MLNESVKEQTMLIDLHAHTKGISRCCRVHAPEVLAAAKEVGLDGICLCNHYTKGYVENGDALAFARRYHEEFRTTRALGEAMGLAVFFGIEVSMCRHQSEHMLVYGVDETFPLRHPDLYDMTQQELYELVHAAGGVLVQAHTMRMGNSVLMDPAWLDGVEVNCHPKYDRCYCKEMAQLAKSRNWILTCGGDYHADTHRVRCGMYLPRRITDGVQLGQYLKTAGTVKLCVQEVGEMTAFDMEYSKY